MFLHRKEDKSSRHVNYVTDLLSQRSLNKHIFNITSVQNRMYILCPSSLFIKQ